MTHLLWICYFKNLNTETKRESFVYVRRITTLAFIAYARIFIRCCSVYTHSSLTLHQLILRSGRTKCYYSFLQFIFISFLLYCLNSWYENGAWTNNTKTPNEKRVTTLYFKKNRKFTWRWKSLELSHWLNLLFTAVFNVHTVRFYTFAIADLQQYLLHFNSNKCFLFFFFTKPKERS